MASPNLTDAQVFSLVQNLTNFKNSITNGQNALANVITQGTILYSDANFAAEFPNSIVAYKAWLLSVQSAINTFITNFPAAPALNG